MHDIDAIVDLPFAAPMQVDFNGCRDTNNSTRVFFNAANQRCFDVCHRVASAFKQDEVVTAIEQRTGADLSDTNLRIGILPGHRGVLARTPYRHRSQEVHDACVSVGRAGPG